MNEGQIKEFFRGELNELESIVTLNSSIVNYLSNQNSVCNDKFILDKIKNARLLGEGAQGYVVLMRGEGGRSYVVKHGDPLNIELQQNIKNRRLEDVAREIGKRYMLDVQTIIKINGNDPNKIVNEIYIPHYAKICLTNKTMSFPIYDTITNPIQQFRIDSEMSKFPDRYEMIVLPAGSYICDQEVYSEFVNGVFCAELLNSGVSINFMDIFGFITCDLIEKPVQFIFMEVLGGSFIKDSDPPNTEASDFVLSDIMKTKANFVQIFHALGVLQRAYNALHADLHVHNIFYKKIEEEKTFNGENLMNADYFHYKILDIDLYIPSSQIKYIMKIGDLGRMFKFSPPYVGSELTISTYANASPNWPSPTYDMIFFTLHLFYTIKRQRMNDTSIPYIMSVISKLLGQSRTISEQELRKFKSFPDQPSRLMPIEIMKIDKYGINPYSILSETELFGEYIIPKPNGKIITLGVI